jgi:hypothetical protein
MKSYVCLRPSRPCSCSRCLYDTTRFGDAVDAVAGKRSARSLHPLIHVAVTASSYGGLR